MLSRRAFLGRGAAVVGAAALPAPAWAFARRKAEVAETAIVGARVLSMDASVSGATAVAIAGGRLIAVGSDAEVQALAGSSTEVINASGATLLPGIHDGHAHPFDRWAAPHRSHPQLRPAQHRQLVKRIGRLLAKSVEREPDGWLAVSLWDATAMDEMPTKEDLDRLPTERPILVISLDGHIALANSRALELAGVDASTPDPRAARSVVVLAASRPGSCSTTRSASSRSLIPGANSRRGC